MVRLYYEFNKVSDNLDFVNVKEGDVAASFKTNKIFEGDLQNISITRNMDNIIHTATISDLPYEEVYHYIAKYDKITVYYDYYDLLLGQQVTITLFNGEVMNKSSVYSNGQHFVTLELMSKGNLLTRVRNPYQSKGESLQQYIRDSLLDSGLSDTLGLKFYMERDILGRFNPSGKLIEELREIRKKYAVMIFEDEANDIVVATPYFLRKNLENVQVYNLDMNNYPMNISIQNLFSDINTIVAIGFSTKKDKTMCFGIAFDPFSYRINGGEINYRIEYAFDITGGKPALSQFALSKLMEEARQYKIKITNIPFENRFLLGQLVSITNHPEINPGQIFMIEEIQEDISIDDSKVDLVVSGYALGLIPEDITLGNEKAFGALNADVNIALSDLEKKRSR